MKFPILELNKYLNSFDILPGIFSVFGDFGVGKTTFALQTAINLAKLGKFIIYIYTKPKFPSEKILLINKYSNDLLNNILFIQTTKFEELNLIIFNFEFLILNYLKSKKTNLELIIVDSMTNLYRLELNKAKKEKNYNLNYRLNQMLATLTYLNEVYDIEILVINEISRKTLDGLVIDIPSGGNVMNFWVKYNLKIIRTNKLSERKFFFTDINRNNTIEFLSNLREGGFE
jgi:RecA/RadA recombinase